MVIGAYSSLENAVEKMQNAIYAESLKKIRSGGGMTMRVTSILMGNIRSGLKNNSQMMDTRFFV